MKKYESYKISGMRFEPKRRETESAAKTLAEKLRKSGKHGTVEGVWYDEERGMIQFDKLFTF